MEAPVTPEWISRIDWNRLEAEVGMKIRMLQASIEQQPEGDVKALYVRDIATPLMAILVNFCEAFTIGEPEDA